MKMKNFQSGKSLKTAFIILFISSIILSYSGLALSAGNPADAFFRLRVIHTNDTHGNIQKVWKNGLSDITGVRAMRGEINKKDANSNVLILDAGDFTNGKKADPKSVASDMAAMAAAGYDAAALGNHDIKLGIDRLKEISKNSNIPVSCL